MGGAGDWLKAKFTLHHITELTRFEPKAGRLVTSTSLLIQENGFFFFS